MATYSKTGRGIMGLGAVWDSGTGVLTFSGSGTQVRSVLSVTFYYDGLNPNGTVTATINGPVLDANYEFACTGPNGGNETDTAWEDPLVFYWHNIRGDPGESFVVSVRNADTGAPLGAAVFYIGLAGTGEPNPPGFQATWDGIGTFTLTYPAQGYGIYIAQQYGTGTAEDDSGNAGTLTLTDVLGSSPGGDIIFVEVEGSDGTWNHDVAAYWVYPGDPHVYPLGGGFRIDVTPQVADVFLAGALDVQFSLSAELTGGSPDIATLAFDPPPGFTVSPVSPTINEDGGLLTITVTVAPDNPEGIYTIPFTATDTDETVAGNLRLILSYTWCVQAIAVANRAKSTVFVGANFVRDDEGWISTDVSHLIGESDREATFILSGEHLPPATGQYRVHVHYLGDVGSNSQFFVKRNGWPLYPIAWCWSGDQNEVDPYITGPPDNNSGPGPTYVPITTGDVIEIVQNVGRYYYNPDPDRVARICFTRVTDKGPVPMRVWCDAPEVVGSSDPEDLVQGNADTSGGDFRYSPSRVVCCVTDDGAVYAAQANTVAQANGVTLSRWRPGETGWTVVEANVWDLGQWYWPSYDSYGLYGWIDIASDGTDVYVLFCQWDGTWMQVAARGGTAGNFNWRVKKYTPATNKLTELGPTGNFRGTWTDSPSPPYEPGDSVIHDGILYFYKVGGM